MLDHGGTGELAAWLAIESLELSYTTSGDAALMRALQKPFLRQQFSGHDFHTILITTSVDGRYLLTAGADKTVRLWDAHEGAALRVLSDFDVPVRSAAFSPDSRYYAIGYSGYIWVVDSDEPVRILDREDHGSVQCVAWSHNGYLLASGNVCVWQAQSGELMDVFKHETPIKQVYFAQNRPVLFAIITRSVTLWHVDTHSRLQIIQTGRQRITAVCPLSDRNQLLIGTHNGSIQCWDCSNGRMIDMFKAQTMAVVAGR